MASPDKRNPAQRHQGQRGWLGKLEQASEEGDADFIARSMPRLAELIADCMEWQVKIAEFEQRARLVRDRHEPGA